MALVIDVDLEESSSNELDKDEEINFFDLSGINLESPESKNSLGFLDLSNLGTPPKLKRNKTDPLRVKDKAKESPVDIDLSAKKPKRTLSRVEYHDPLAGAYDSSSSSSSEDLSAKKKKRAKKAKKPAAPKKPKKKTKAQMLLGVEIRLNDAFASGRNASYRRDGLLNVFAESCLSTHDGMGIVVYDSNMQQYLPHIFHVITAREFETSFVPERDDIGASNPPSELAAHCFMWQNEWQEDERSDARHTLIIEGTAPDNFNAMRYNRTKLWLQVVRGVNILETKSGRATGETLAKAIRINVEKRIDTSTAEAMGCYIVHKQKSSLDHRENYTVQLMSIPGISRGKAAAIVREFPTLRSLTSAYYGADKTAEEKRQLLSSISAGKNRIGPTISERVYMFYQTRDPSVRIIQK